MTSPYDETNMMIDGLFDMTVRAEKAEARVAELETWLDGIRKFAVECEIKSVAEMAASALRGRPMASVCTAVDRGGSNDSVDVGESDARFRRYCDESNRAAADRYLDWNAHREEQ